jgi:hypothetical protein
MTAMSFHLVVQAGWAQFEPVSKLLNLVEDFLRRLFCNGIPTYVTQDQRGMTFHPFSSPNVTGKAYPRPRLRLGGKSNRALGPIRSLLGGTDCDGLGEIKI